MRKLFTKIICVLSALIVAASLFALTACDKTYKAKALPGDYTSTEKAASNGGFAVEYGNYVYFINGVENNSASNDFGSVVKGAIMRISKQDLAARNYSSTQTVVPLIAYSGSYNGGIFIYGDYIYYSTPSTEKDNKGNVQYNYLTFKRTKLDGTDTMRDYYLQNSNSAIDYRYVEKNGTVYLMYVATNEDLYGTSVTNIHSVNTATGKDTLLAYNIVSYVFDSADSTNPRMYYTMRVTDFKTTTTAYTSYNQIYTVEADATEAKDYSEYFADVEDYDKDKNPMYVNCGDLVYDGVGFLDGKLDKLTPFNADGAEEIAASRRPLSYALTDYQHGRLFYTRTSSIITTGRLYIEKEADLLARTHKAYQDLTDDQYFVNNGSAASNYYYLYDADDEIEKVLIPDSIGIIISDLTADGKLAYSENDNKLDYTGKTSFEIPETGGATFLFMQSHGGERFMYYSLSGGNGYTVYRVNVDGTYDDYKKGPQTETTAYQGVQVLDIDSVSAWYKPEMFEGQILFASETDRMTAYNYVMACDIRNASGEVMTNAELKEYKEKYDEISEKISDVDDDVYPNLENALKYAFFACEGEYIRQLRQAYVDVLGNDLEKYWSDASLEKYDEFLKAEGDWSEFADKHTVNGKEYAANTRDYYYTVIGQMKDSDKKDYDEQLKSGLLRDWPEEPPTKWDTMSKGAKAGIIIGSIVGGMLLIGAVVFVVLFLVFRKKSEPSERRVRYKVDTTDDKSVDVYSTDGETPSEEESAESETPSEEENTESETPAEEDNAESETPAEEEEPKQDDGAAE